MCAPAWREVEPGLCERFSDDEPRIVRCTHYTVLAVYAAKGKPGVVPTAGRFLTLPPCTDAWLCAARSDYLFKVRSLRDLLRVTTLREVDGRGPLHGLALH